EKSMLLTRHWRTMDPNADAWEFRDNFKDGLYNAGFVGASKKGLVALNWWAEACLYKCEKDPANGFWDDQRYLDVVPDRFQDVEILAHQGCNVAYWNRRVLKREEKDGKVWINGKWSVVFVHFTGALEKEIREKREMALTGYWEKYQLALKSAGFEEKEGKTEKPAKKTQNRPPIALISPNEAAWSETFIRAQTQGLPADVHFLYGAFLPRYHSGGTHFISNTYLLEGLAYAKDRLLRRELHSTLRNRISAYLRKHQIKAVLAQYGPSGVEMMDICAAVNIPLVVHFHGYDAFDSELLSEYGHRYPTLFEKAAAIVVVSRAMERRLIDLGAPPQKLHYNPCGADTTRFQPVDPGKNPPVFFAAGRFSETKSPHLTVLAFARIAAEFPAARLRIAGAGPLRGATVAQIRALQLEDKVELLGVLDHEAVAAEMARARAFVQHSVTTVTGDAEGTPVAIMEAGAAGLPVISTLHAGIPDVVLHEETGLLVPEHDVEGMAQAMRHLARNPEAATAMGQAARQRIQAEFSLSGRLDRLWHLISEVMR
ncbi:MAG: glycosyltransferase, partial [Bacteroidota bacterium]